MEILSFVGILIGLLLFIVLCFKRFNTILSVILSVLIMLLFSMPALRGNGLDIYQMLIPGGDGFTSYMTGVSGFLKSYLILFMLSALYGKVMDDSGAIRRIALTLKSAVVKSPNAKFLAVCVLPVFYTVLGYCGISGFVMVFAVVALGRELFTECDVPWRFYCYGAVGNLTNGILAGNLQAQNLKATELFGVAPTAGFAMSVVFCFVQLLVAGIMIYCDVKRSDRLGEGFATDGAEMLKEKMDLPKNEENLPGLVSSLIPILLTVLIIIVFKLPAETTLTISIIVCFILYRKYLPNLKTTLSSGLTIGVGPVVTVAAVAGLATIIPQMPGFSLITGVLDKLPDMYGGIALVAIITLFVANAVPVFTSQGVTNILVQKFSALSAGNAARLALCSQITTCPPWNAGVINAVALTKLDLKKAAWIYFKSSFFPGLAGLAVVVILIKIGIFV